MDKVLADKSSPSEDSNSPNTLSKFSEVPKQAKSNRSLKKKVWLKSSHRAVWEKHMPAKLEENP